MDGRMESGIRKKYLYRMRILCYSWITPGRKADCRRSILRGRSGKSGAEEDRVHSVHLGRWIVIV